jgi:hypothetical protein
MNIALTGATGFIGRRLTQQLEAAGHKTRGLGRNASTGRLEPSATDLAGCEAVIHLAGEPVSQRWSAAVKERIRASRVEGTQKLVAAIGKTGPRVLISASAVGYYGDRPGEVLTESSSGGQGFLAEVSAQWEDAALAARAFGVRVAVIRIGIVLGPGGGALAKMLPAFRAGVGGRLGSGEQYMPWIHLDDLCALFRFAVENPAVDGPLNGVAPEPVTNAEFTRILARVLHRPALLPVPRFAVNLLFGEMAQILFWSQRVVPRTVEAAGFRFGYPRLEQALRAIVLL